MPTFDVDISGATYEVDAPDENTAWQWANQEHAKTADKTVKEPSPGFFSNLVESFTGTQRSTPTIEAMPDWRTNMPEFTISQGIPALKTSIGTMFANPEETAKIIKSNFPEVQISQDEKGNFIFKSAIDDKQYAIKPGFRASDLPRAVAGALAFGPAGKATTIAGAALAGGATQAAIEGSQAAVGGDFDAGEIGAATVLGGAGEAVAKILGMVIPGARRVLQGKSFIPKDIQETIPQVFQETANADLKDILTKATGSGLSASKAQRQLAELANVNPEALAYASELGIPISADVFSDNPQMRATVGSSRNITGSASEAAWRTAQQESVEAADKALLAIDATPDVASVSDKVLSALKTERDRIKEATKASYTTIDEEVGKSTLVLRPIKKELAPILSAEEQQAKQLEENILKASGKYVAPEPIAPAIEGVGLPNLKALLDQTKKNVGIEGLTSQEAKLMNMLNSQDVTYERLVREKKSIRNALRGKDSPYRELDAAILDNLYSAISADQASVIEKVAGAELKDRFLATNLEYAKQKQLEKTLVNVFGNTEQGSIVPLMRTAAIKASQGEVPALNKLLDVVPKELQKETLASAIMAATQDQTAQFRGQFGFAQFDKFYSGLKRNQPIFEKVNQVLGPEAAEVFKGLHVISKYMTEARANVLSTGKANQAVILQELRSKSFLDRVLGSAVAGPAGSAVGSMLGGPAGAFASNYVMQMLGRNKDLIDATGKLFLSPEFQKLMVDTATKSVPSSKSIEALAKSSVFSKFSQLSKVPSDTASRVRWIKHALMSEQDFMMPQSAFAPDRTVAEVLPNGTVKSDPLTKFKIIQKPGGKYRLFSPDGEVAVFSTEDEALKAATKKLRILTNSPLK